MKVKLQWLIGDKWYEEKVNTATPVTIGRLHKCRITVNDPTVSREHATLYTAAGVVHVRNLSKTNAIRFIDGTVLKINETAPLTHASSFTLGKVKVRILFEGQEEV